ncbi:DUF3887 domain-containing protein [Dyella subtropica]|uniref:DUF3887 domain-containing protein n=1 Tax=Dyella subtropica TaxID=2992127 RepID=UPI0022558487|nr:DUF3887 domain-containing protein [Dyella subtropica]
MKPLGLIACMTLAAFAVTAHAETPCETLSTHLLDALDRGDYAGATADFDPTMKAKLSPDTLSQVWQAIPQQFGERGARETAQSSQLGDHTVVLTALHYGQSMVDSQVACSADGKIAGFNIKPHH